MDISCISILILIFKCKKKIVNCCGIQNVVKNFIAMVTTVKDLLKKRGSHVYSISPKHTVYQALQLMAEKDVGALVVMDDDRIVGMFSERDYARKLILRGRSSKNTPVGELMSTKVYFVSPDQSIENCMTLMTMKKIRHVPVMEKGKLIGMISIGDLVNKIISSQITTIKDLEDYIVGGYGTSVE
jgi:CBS domain-containing protein